MVWWMTYFLASLHSRFQFWPEHEFIRLIMSNVSNLYHRNHDRLLSTGFFCGMFSAVKMALIISRGTLDLPCLVLSHMLCLVDWMMTYFVDNLLGQWHI